MSCGRKLRCLLLGSVLLTPGFRGEVNADVATEAQIKAAYLYHILHFVDWPPGRGNLSTSPINICVLGEGGGNNALRALASKTISKRPLMVSFIDETSSDYDCQLLFVRDISYLRLSSLLRIIGRKGVLTVGDSADFANDGGMIGFVIINGTVRIEINLAAVKNAGFQVSAKLLEVAVKIIDQPDRNS